MNKSHIISLYQYRACSPINALRPLVVFYVLLTIKLNFTLLFLLHLQQIDLFVELFYTM